MYVRDIVDLWASTSSPWQGTITSFNENKVWMESVQWSIIAQFNIIMYNDELPNFSIIVRYGGVASSPGHSQFLMLHMAWGRG